MTFRTARARFYRLCGACVAWAGIAFLGHALAQQPGTGAQGPTPSTVTGSTNGHVQYTGGGIPTMTGGTISDGSTDNMGTFTASAASGLLTFAFPYARAPMCGLDNTAATQATWNATSQGIVLTTIVSGNTYTWQCFARPGG